jgi:ATP phosphoribosyltransferase
LADLLRLAIQKSGRLFDGTQALLKECDIEFGSGKAALKVRAFDFPVEFYFLRDDDIPTYVADGVADAGIVGLNALKESGAEVSIAEPLGFGRCRLCLAVPKGMTYKEIGSLAGKRIATSHPRILREFLKEKGVGAHIHELSGSVEIAPSIGLAEAICDLVSTGSTLASNGLTEVETVLDSEAVLITRKNLPVAQQAILDQLMFRARAVRKARHNKYIVLNAPNKSLDKIIALIPGAKSPSVMALATSGWSSVHSVVSDHDFWEVIGSLKAAGAEGILVLPIEKMIA